MTNTIDLGNKVDQVNIAFRKAFVKSTMASQPGRLDYRVADIYNTEPSLRSTLSMSTELSYWASAFWPTALQTFVTFLKS